MGEIVFGRVDVFSLGCLSVSLSIIGVQEVLLKERPTGTLVVVSDVAENCRNH